MKYRKLGDTGFEVSEIGFGTWGLGGDSYGPVGDQVSTKALRRAFDLGVNFYDTSDLYGNGHSEELLGEVFKDVRDKIIIATKGGLLPHNGFHMPEDFSPQHLVHALERSLKRLNSDYIDLYQLHSPKIETIEKSTEIIEVLERFQKEGKIRVFGISVRSPDDGKIAIERYSFPVVQVNFNMIDQRAIENGLFDLASEKQVGIIARTPLVFGFLTGKLDGNEQFQGVDHRANWPKEQLQRWAKASDLFSSLNNGKDRTPTQLALCFCLSHGAVTTVIPGMMNPEEVEENTGASELPRLTSKELRCIIQTYRGHDFYDKLAKQKGDK